MSKISNKIRIKTADGFEEVQISYIGPNNTWSEGSGEAIGKFSHAEGNGSQATGDSSHAEGFSTEASGGASHAEGNGTKASASNSHAEGFKSIASGNSSHAEGCGTKASGTSQHVQGEWNIEDTTNTYAHIVGNGTSDTNRSNAHTLDWYGNAWFAGDIEGKSIISRGTDDEVPQVKFYKNNDTDYNIRIRTDHPVVDDIEYNDLYFEGANSYYFDNSGIKTSNLFTGAKKGVTDGVIGANLNGSGNLHMLGASAPFIGFYVGEGSTSMSSQIQATSDTLKFERASSGYVFDNKITVNNASVFARYSFYSGNKGDGSDGKTGCVLGDNGRLYLQATEPAVLFYPGNVTTAEGGIYMNTSDRMTFDGASDGYVFNGTIKSTGSMISGGDVNTGGKTYYGDGQTGIALASSGNIHMQHNSSPSLRMYRGTSTDAKGRIYIDSNDYMQFGNSGRYQFGAQIYSTTSTIGVSDRNKKKDFTSIDERYENLFFDLKPQVYKFKDGTSDRFHTGFISQDVEESMFNNGLDSKDFAGYCKEIQRRTIVDTEEEFVEEEVYDENGNPVYDYFLRYEEFIALNTYMLQKAYTQMAKMQDEINNLKAELQALK